MITAERAEKGGKEDHQQVEILWCHAFWIHILGARVKDVYVCGHWFLYVQNGAASWSLGLGQPLELAALGSQRLESSLDNRGRQRRLQRLEEVATALHDILEHLVGIE